jgi:hypothetical protein
VRAATSAADTEQLPELAWTKDDLGWLREYASATVIAALDLSAETPGAWIPLRQIEERAGRELAQARADLAVLTMTVKRHFGRSSWPFVQEWAAGAMGANERARQPGRTRLAGSVRTAVNDPHRSAAAPRASISAAGIDDEIERSPLNDRSIATNHSADSPASPPRE